MDRRAFLGAAGAAVAWPAVAAEWLQPAAGLTFDEINSGFPKDGPTTVAEFNVWLRQKFNVVGSINCVPAPGAMHHAVIVSKSVEWIDDTDGLLMAAERQCVRSAVLLIQSAIDMNPKAFGADLWFRRAPHVLVDREWEANTRFMMLRCRVVCSEDLPGVTKPIHFPGALANAWRVA